MNAPILYNLFTALRKEERLTAGGIGEYLVLEEQLTHEFNFDNYDDFVFACEILLVKDRSQQEVFRAIMNSWRTDIENYIRIQKDKIEKFRKSSSFTDPLPKKPEPLQATPPPTPVGRNPAQQPGAPTPVDTPSITPSTSTETAEQAEEAGEAEITISLIDETAGEQGQGKAFKPADASLPADPGKQFLLGNEYFPVANRYLRQNWRTLKNRQEINEYGTVDLMATIEEITKTGLFLDFQYKKKNTNLLSLFIFIDRGSSMAATEAFGKELAESAKQSGIHLDIKPWYFYNVPEMTGEEDSPEYMLLNEDETDARTISQLFRNQNKKNIVTLVYSDAGSLSLANKDLLAIRERNTIDFLRYLLRNTAYTAWLNPAPRHRWHDTMAEKVSRAYPETGMFEANSTGFEQAINALRGKIAIK